MSTSSGDSTAYKWSKHEYTLQDIYDANDFPVVVMVIGGFYGESAQETVSSGDVLRLHSRGTHKRAIASDLSRHSSSYYSIPVDYEVPFALVKPQPPGTQRNFAPATRLSKLLEKESLPFKVQMVLAKHRSLHLGADPRQKLSLDVMEIKDVYEEKFFKANSILNGSFYQEVIVVPTYLKQVRVVTAGGLASRNATPSQWQRQMSRWTAAASALNFKAIGPSKEIMVYTQESVDAANNIYDTIEPNTYVALSEVTNKDPQHYVQLTHAVSTGPPSLPSGPRKPPPTMPRRASVPADKSNPPALPNKPRMVATPLAQVRPIVDNKSEGPTDDVYEDYQSPESRPFQIRSIQDIPSDIRGLGCQELTECLRLLNMESYIETFRQHQINGDLMYSLDEAMMKVDLGINAIHARKLFMFAHKGWRPDIDA